jgi:hypothetical protein
LWPDQASEALKASEKGVESEGMSANFNSLLEAVKLSSDFYKLSTSQITPYFYGRSELICFKSIGMQDR